MEIYLSPFTDLSATHYRNILPFSALLLIRPIGRPPGPCRPPLQLRFHGNKRRHDGAESRGGYPMAANFPPEVNARLHSLPHSLTHTLPPSFIQQIAIKHLLAARPCAKGIER